MTAHPTRQSADRPRSVFDEIMAAIVADRAAYLKDFLDSFYNDELRPHGSATRHGS